MTWEELRKQITELGFNVVNSEYDDIYTEMRDAYIFSANRAIDIIAATVRPILGEYIISFKKNICKRKIFEENFSYDKAYRPYDIRRLAGERFYDFAADMPMLETSGGGYQPLAGFQTQKRGVIFIPADAVAPGNKVHVWYKKKPTVITADTDGGFEIELDHDVLPLVPLLASHYVWLDDEPSKASLYWNQYDILKNQILQNSEGTRTEPRLYNTTGWW